MSYPKISVLMPIYNTQEDHLKQAIGSVLGQTYTDFEFLILNDSPDNMALDELVKSFRDPRIRYIKNPHNLGITPSRNKLIELAEGEYLAVMDHDDISLPTRFEEQVRVLDSRPEIGVVGCWVEHFLQNKTTYYLENNADIERHLMTGCAIAHTAAMIRKSALGGIRYEEKFTPSEDYALWCRLIGKTQFYNIPKTLMRYRRYDENTSKKQAEKMATATKAIFAFVRAEHPDIWQDVCAHTPHIVRLKLFGVIPCGRFAQQGNQRPKWLKWLPFISARMKLLTGYKIKHEK